MSALEFLLTMAEPASLQVEEEEVENDGNLNEEEGSGVEELELFSSPMLRR